MAVFFCLVGTKKKLQNILMQFCWDFQKNWKKRFSRDQHLLANFQVKGRIHLIVTEQWDESVLFEEHFAKWKINEKLIKLLYSI